MDKQRSKEDKKKIKEDKKKNKKNYEQIGQDEEWVEMSDLNRPSNQAMNMKFAQIEGKQYEPPLQQLNVLSEAEFTRTPNNDGPQGQTPNPELGMRREKGQGGPPSLPMMDVTCEHCTVAQNVPGNTQVYICGSCENMNECYPLYGVAVCGVCKARVGFGFGTSHYVKCPTCASISRVPLEPIKNYESIGQLGPSVPVQPEQHQVISEDLVGKRGAQESLQYVGLQGAQGPQLQYVGVEPSERSQM